MSAPLYVPREPTAIALGYRRTIALWVSTWELESLRVVLGPTILQLTAQQRRARGLDAADDELDVELDRAFAHVQQLQPDVELGREALTRARQVDALTEREVGRQLKRATGRDVLAQPRGGAELEATFVRDNVALIGQMRRQARDSVELIVRNGWRSGATAEDLAKEIRRRYGFMKKSRALLIASDQVGKLNGEMSRARMLGAGVGEGYWRTKRDGKVRDAHRHLEGTRFDLQRGVPIERFPGWPIRCRCWTEPIVLLRGPAGL